MSKCGCGKHEVNKHDVKTPAPSVQGCGCGGGNCGCGGRGKRRGQHTENTPVNAPVDHSQGRKQLGLRGK